MWHPSALLASIYFAKTFASIKFQRSFTKWLETYWEQIHIFLVYFVWGSFTLLKKKHNIWWMCSIGGKFWAYPGVGGWKLGRGLFQLSTNFYCNLLLHPFFEFYHLLLKGFGLAQSSCRLYFSIISQIIWNKYFSFVFHTKHRWSQKMINQEAQLFSSFHWQLALPVQGGLHPCK